MTPFLFFVFFVLLCCLCVSAGEQGSQNVKQYRTDYVYNAGTDAFYKFHINAERLPLAVQHCSFEGAKLLSPIDRNDLRQAHAMFKNYPDLGDFIFVADDKIPHEPAEDEHPIINLDPRPEDLKKIPFMFRCVGLTRMGDIKEVDCGTPLPFVCKVEAKNALYDKQCNVYGSDYIYIDNVSSCYKFSRIALNWNAAYAYCDAERSHLVVLNSNEEHDAVKGLMGTAERAENALNDYFFWAGYHVSTPTNGSNRVFKTIFNQTLQEAGYAVWAENEPNNALNKENCICLFKNDGNFNDLDCHVRVGFICEKEVPRTR